MDSDDSSRPDRLGGSALRTVLDGIKDLDFEESQ